MYGMRREGASDTYRMRREKEGRSIGHVSNEEGRSIGNVSNEEGTTYGSEKPLLSEAGRCRPCWTCSVGGRCLVGVNRNVSGSLECKSKNAWNANRNNAWNANRDHAWNGMEYVHVPLHVGSWCAG